MKYITTPLYYLNAEPHLGHAYTTVLADVYARFLKLTGEPVRFITGSDEHGVKIFMAAEKAGISPKEFVDAQVEKFKNNWKKLNIEYDYFVRTTDLNHEKNVQENFRKLKDAGYIYKGVYEGWYCVYCERFILEDELVDGKLCPDCKREVERYQEENYFFKLSAFQQQLLEFYEKNPDFVLPANKLQEVKNRVKEGLKDLCITRKKFPWGIPVPDDEDYSIYVWFEALQGYLTAAGYGWRPDLFKACWPPHLQLIGKDILWFHAVIWPAMLMALNLPVPRRLGVHGIWLFEGEKMSKSRGNVVSPKRVVEEYSVDFLRYYLCHHLPFGKDGSISLDSMFKTFNNVMVNEIGNTERRISTLLVRINGGRYVPYTTRSEELEIKGLAENLLKIYPQKMRDLEFREVLEEINKLNTAINEYLNESAPWRIASENPDLAAQFITFFAAAKRVAYSMLYPFIPFTVETVFKRLRFGKPSLEPTWELSNEKPLEIGEVLYQRKKKVPTLGIRKETPEIEPSPSESAGKKERREEKRISIEEFQKVELVVGKVLEVEEIEGAKKLYKLEVDVGDETITLVAGVKQHYTPEQLKHKLVVVVRNLKKAKIRGVVSEGMLLAASGGGKLALLTVDSEIPPGSKIS